MKKHLLLMFSALSILPASARRVTLTVSNSGNNQRQEVVEVDLGTVCRTAGCSNDAQLTVRNGFGQEVACQRTSDGKLLIDVAVQPHGNAVYTIDEGKPSDFRHYVYGRIFPERADDFAWENDRGIYRMYGPALQRTGERSFGTDVWTKNTPELVLEQRYRQHNRGVRQRDSLRRAGKPGEAEEIYLATSFHHDHGYGLDCYGVGPSLGCGAPALMKEGHLVFPWCYKECRIIDNGPLRLTFELTYGTTDEGTTEHRMVSLDKGSHFNRMTVWYDGIRQRTALAAGVVLHGGDKPVLGKNYILYADPTDNPKVNQTQIYVATLFPNGIDKAVTLEGEKPHAVGVVNGYKGERYTYYFGSAWSSYDVGTQAQWQLTVDTFLNNLSNPLKIEIK